MSEYIDKDSVLKYIIFGVVGKDITCGELKEAIESLPTIEFSERRGEWIPVKKVYKTNDDDFPNTHIVWVTATEPDDIDAVSCSECGEVFDFEDARNWCTECGAKMKGNTE